MHEILVNRLGGLSLPRKSLVRLTDRPDMTIDVYRGRKSTSQQQSNYNSDGYYSNAFEGAGYTFCPLLKQSKCSTCVTDVCVDSFRNFLAHCPGCLNRDLAT